jgi:hypothetical protein
MGKEKIQKDVYSRKINELKREGRKKGRIKGKR